MREKSLKTLMIKRRRLKIVKLLINSLRKKQIKRLKKLNSSHRKLLKKKTRNLIMKKEMAKNWKS